jgi:hypothetical protein
MGRAWGGQSRLMGVARSTAPCATISHILNGSLMSAL